MPDLEDGTTIEMKGSGSRPYIIKNVGGVYSCTCPAWRNQSLQPHQRTCKHIRKLRGDDAEKERLGAAALSPPTRKAEGEPKEGPPVLLAESWDTQQDVKGWWMSEKLDGARAFWDGKQFVSRLGNTFVAPDFFMRDLPDVPLDGELWIARKSFQRTMSVIKRQDRPAEWAEVRYVVFDAPAHGGAFEARMRFLGDLLGKHPSDYVRPLAQEPCRGTDHLLAELDRMAAVGGEGLMLRQPGSLYEAGRSSTLLKVKRFHDAEARVIGYLPGAGKHKGRTGSLEVQLTSGVRFAVGTGLSDAERVRPPAIGSTISFRYQELSDGGVPRFPSYVGVREANPAVAVPATPSLGAASSTVKVAISTPNGRRRFELVEGTSSKFWEVWVDGSRMNAKYGRIGSEGTTTIKDFPDEEAAQKAMDKAIAEKVKKGYGEAK
jgi:DNA ligase-1